MDDRPPRQADGTGGDASGMEAARLVDALQRFGHDMRSAVSDVVGGLRLVDFDRLDPETRTQLERVSAAGDVLASLVESVLLTATGTADSGSGAFRLGTLVGQWRRRWTGHARETGAAFDVVDDLDPSLFVRAPQMVVDRIVSNMLANALDHAAGADVRLTLGHGDGGDLVVEVADGGPGFDPDAVLRQPCAGHGLGLRIARDLASELGGTLAISRGPPLGGAVVRLTLPRDRVQVSNGPGPMDAAWSDLSDVAILVAEDNPTNRVILKNVLERLGAKPVFAANGAEALLALEQTRFDIALIDIEMPLVSGLEVIREVRARTDAAARMPLVALTAYVLRDNREAIYAAGADGIIGKPVASIEEFGRTILRYAGRPAGLPEPEDVLAGGGTDPAFGEKMDEARLDDLLSVAGDDGARELLERLSEDLCSVRDKLAAGVAAQSLPMIREQTHILVAISGSVGADRLCRLTEVLNIAAKRRRLDDLEALHAPCRADLDDLIALIASRGLARV